MVKRIEAYFLVYFSPQDPAYFRARLLVRFVLVTICFAIAYFITTFFTGFVTARMVMMACMLMYTFQLFALRARVSLMMASQLYAFSCWVIVFFLALCSGGIHSVVVPWTSLVPLVALLLMGQRYAWMWGAIGIGTVLFLFFTDQQISIPAEWQAPPSNLRIASLHIGLLAIMLSLTYMFHRLERELVNTIQERNEELDNANATIEQQRDEIILRNQNLEGEVEKRTRELLDYNQQLEQFAFIASHNLRAPVASLLGLGQLLEVSASNKEDVEQICINMITTARELDRVVRDLSTILEIRNASHALLTDIDMEEEVKRVCISLEREILDTKAVIRTDFTATNSILTVRPLMDSILMNLISNALKYRHPDRSPVILIKTVVSNDEVCLSVEDNGLGIDLKEYGEKLFTLYGRFHSHVDGKGLGLYLVKTHVTAMSGRIAVASEEGRGTTFSVYLKRQAAAQA
ncbi:MAG: hypothetical protein JNK10_13980 [Cyclobacteriaceae bacterium]|nr:hypothetical protein [Cyclobacteriaceae bacterium]